MRRFFFDLEGKQSASDPAGLPFESELSAFRSAQTLALELGSIRPQLRGNTWVALMSRKRDGDAYYVGV
jgi:hypothetical protein